MAAEALTLTTDERSLVKIPRLRTPELAIKPEAPYIYGYTDAAAFLREIGGPYTTGESLKSICSKIRRRERNVPHFPLPVNNGGEPIFDRRRLAAYVAWRKNLGPEPSDIYTVIDVAEARTKLQMRKVGAAARRELKQLLHALASTEDHAMNRLADAQLRVLVRRFKELLFEYGWDYDTNKRVEVW